MELQRDFDPFWLILTYFDRKFYYPEKIGTDGAGTGRTDGANATRTFRKNRTPTDSRKST